MRIILDLLDEALEVVAVVARCKTHEAARAVRVHVAAVVNQQELYLATDAAILTHAHFVEADLALDRPKRIA